MSYCKTLRKSKSGIPDAVPPMDRDEGHKKKKGWGRDREWEGRKKEKQRQTGEQKSKAGYRYINQAAMDKQSSSKEPN